LVSAVGTGSIPDYKHRKPDLKTVFPGGKIPAGYKLDIFSLTAREQFVWTEWAAFRAAEMMGREDVWAAWPFAATAP
jgi:hypothetical protein